MIIVFLILAILGFFIGHYTRELRNTLLFIKKRLETLHEAQERAKPVNSGIVEPLTTRAELVAAAEEEKIRLLNQ